MPSPFVVVLIAFAGMILTILVHVVSTAWWASKINTTVESLKESVDKFWERLDGYVKRGDYEVQVKKRDDEIHAMKKAHDDLRVRFEDCRAKDHKA